MQITEDIREWDYGDYEGITSPQIRELRKKQGIGGPNGEWDIWREGCPGGEYVFFSSYCHLSIQVLVEYGTILWG